MDDLNRYADRLASKARDERSSHVATFGPKKDGKAYASRCGRRAGKAICRAALAKES